MLLCMVLPRSASKDIHEALADGKDCNESFCLRE